MPKALVTAGPTYEAIDPVRFIGNHSSGKMGYAIAQELLTQGYEVTLVSGPTNIKPPEGAVVVAVRSAEDMFQACRAVYHQMDLAIFSAAVADYTPKHVSKIKIKKDDDEFSIALVKTKDIAKEMGKLKKPHQLNVGFALETNDGELNADKKLRSKNFDFVVLNVVTPDNKCFGTDFNKICILESNKKLEFEFKNKQDIAKDIVKHIETFRN